MIKIKLKGTAEEINSALEILADKFIVISVSKAYTNCGTGIYEQACLNVERLPRIIKTEYQTAFIESKKEGLI